MSPKIFCLRYFCCTNVPFSVPRWDFPSVDDRQQALFTSPFYVFMRLERNQKQLWRGALIKRAGAALTISCGKILNSFCFLKTHVFFIFYMCVLCLYVCMCVGCLPSVHRDQKRASDLLKLELQSCRLPCECGEHSPGLYKNSVLVTAEPALQPVMAEPALQPVFVCLCSLHVPSYWQRT